MDINAIASVVSAVGFPIVCCFGMAYYINTTLKEFTKVMNEQVPVGPQMHYQEEQDIDKEKSEMEKAEEKVRGGWSL